MAWSDLAPPGIYKGYPKTFLAIGDCDGFQQECDQLADLLRTDGVDLTYDVQKDAVHDFWGVGSIVPSEPARERLAKHVAEWVDTL